MGPVILSFLSNPIYVYKTVKTLLLMRPEAGIIFVGVLFVNCDIVYQFFTEPPMCLLLFVINDNTLNNS